jgi:hypothetical protein
LDPAEALLAEFVEVWRSRPTALMSEWLSVLAHTSAVSAADSSALEKIGEVIGTAPIRTRWVLAAETVVAGARAANLRDHRAAAREYALAVERYDAIGGLSDAALAAVWTARAWRMAGDGTAAAPFLTRVRAFAQRNRASVLTDLVS